jgi:hypothetical protein
VREGTRGEMDSGRMRGQCAQAIDGYPTGVSLTVVHTSHLIRIVERLFEVHRRVFLHLLRHGVAFDLSVRSGPQLHNGLHEKAALALRFPHSA